MNNNAIAAAALAIFALGGAVHFATKDPVLAPVSGRAESLTRATLGAYWKADELDIDWTGMVSHEGGTAVCGLARAPVIARFAVLFREEEGERRRHVLLPPAPGWQALPGNCRGD